MSTTRRNFLKAAAGAGLGLPVWASRVRAVGLGTLPPIRQITRGSKHHWFGYYDKLEFDPSNRYVLAMEVDFEHRSPRPDDTIRIGMVDLADGDRWIHLGTSGAWCWQQGCMLQWRPGTTSEVLWNDRQGDRYVCHLLDVKTRAKRTLPHPIYCVSPDGRWALAPDFRRLADVRPGYGYVGLPDPNRDVLAPRDTGIFRIDLETGRQELLLSVADVARLPYAYGDLSAMKHWFNHLLINPDGSRFTFLHRWAPPGKLRLATRMITAAADGSDVRVLIGSGDVSHFIWRDSDHILAYCKLVPGPKWGFFLVADRPDRAAEQTAKEAVHSDGHCSYLPGKQWILCDSYPDQERRQHLFLYDPRRRRRVELGAFRSPKGYDGEWRCDLHPRFSRDGRSVVIDSPHTGQGRQLHLIDISHMVG
jgi:hypothetical protein